jgi:acyl-CoA synthetase (AMP-forming)/AMP-acid ligase II
VGTPAPVIGEIGVAFVIPADPSEPPTLAELRSWVATDLADYKTPDRLVVVDDLPPTSPTCTPGGRDHRRQDADRPGRRAANTVGRSAPSSSSTTAAT